MQGRFKALYTCCRKASWAELDRASRGKAVHDVQGRLAASSRDLQDVKQALEMLQVLEPCATLLTPVEMIDVRASQSVTDI